MAANCDELRAEVKAFRGAAPLAAALRAPGMRPRHWDALSAQARAAGGAGGRVLLPPWPLLRAMIVPAGPTGGAARPPTPSHTHTHAHTRTHTQIGQPLSLEGGLTLAQALERGLAAQLPAIAAAADVAGKEFAIEQARAAPRPRALPPPPSAPPPPPPLPRPRRRADANPPPHPSPPAPTPPPPQALDKLAAEWEAAELGVIPYRDSGTHVVKARARAP